MNPKEKSRIKILDILRGFAILGTLGTNIWIFAYLGDLNYVLTFKYNQWWSSLDTLLRTLSLVFINGKMLSLLAIMFGVGLELKYQQALRKGNTWPGVYLWAACILLVEGFLHFTLVMEYDILMSYAITAIMVAWIVKRGEKAIKKSMIFFGSIHVFIYLGITVLLLLTGTSQFSIGEMKWTTLLYQHGTWLEQVGFRLTNFVGLRMELVLAFSSNIFLFLTGVLFMRKGVFSTDKNGQKFRKKMLTYGLCLGIPLNLILLISGGYFDFIVRYVFSAVLAIGYIGVIAWLVEQFQKLRLWNVLGNIGKMALSCYVLQNILCSIIFYGWGFGLGGKVNSISIIFIWIGISIIQMVFATIWLRYFALGPMEKARKVVLRLITRES